ncbi:MAG TPA: maleylpyruvate isomerase family mycothiol-dependent enzyme [Acidimicrobiales bacterium]|jgi:uncharacterized protein (TIGR03083 family)|nr:maleylpyruvate isomerase family mycothiol-dependent enzyme [Acidimicrobiales bacterium]
MSGSTTAEAALRDSIGAERRALAEALAGLPAAAWDTPSLCAGWRVREVVAHMTMPFRYSTARFIREMVRDRGRFNRMADRCARRDAAGPPEELLMSLANNADHPWKPPGGGFEGALVHDVIHSLDVMVPLGLERRVPADRIRLVLQAVTRPKTLKHFGADLAGSELRADDLDWSFGSGRLVVGSAQDLALILSGRTLPAGRVVSPVTE